MATRQHDRMLHADDTTHAHEEHTRQVREPFGLGQGIAMAAGVFFIVLGGIGLARGGVESLTEPTVEVMELGMTPLLAIIHIVLGIIAMAGAASRIDARWTGMFLGAVLVAGGIIALAEQVEALGWNEANGIAYLITGGIAVAAALMTPLVVREDNVAHR